MLGRKTVVERLILKAHGLTVVVPTRSQTKAGRLEQATDFTEL
jgi:hypothetical protein